MVRIVSKLAGILSIALLLCISAGLKKAKASHIAACDLYLTYIGGGQDGCSSTTEYKYIVTLDVYIACEQGSAGPPGFASIRYESVNAGVLNQNLSLSQLDRDTVNDLCAAFKPLNSCAIRQNQQYTAYIRNRFTDTLILPSAQTDWRFWYTTGARNSGIDNISTTNGGTSPTGSVYIEAGLNNLTKYNNSTPRFTTPPLPYICVNQPTNYTNTPIDPNNDSMVSQNQAPLQGANNPYFYRTDGGRTYSAADPVASDPSNPFSFNPTTAVASFTPTNAVKMVLAFRCDEYERGTGVPLGYIMRDIQISVFPCAAPPPSLPEIPLSVTGGEIVNNTILTCPGSNVNFSINSTSPNANSQVYMEAVNIADFATGGGAFNVTGTGTNNATGTFTWTPTQLGDKSLEILTKDSTCSGQGFSIVLKRRVVMYIKVVDGLDAGDDIPYCELSPGPAQLFVKSPKEVDVVWRSADGSPTGLTDNNIVNPVYQNPDRNKTFIVSSPQLKGSCKASDTVSVHIDTSNKVTITPKNPRQPEEALVMCNPGYLQLEALIDGRPPKNNVPCGVSNPTLCSDADTGKVFGSAVFGNVEHDVLEGGNAPVFYNTLRTAKYQYLIKKEELDDADIFSSTIRSIMIETQGTSNAAYEYSNFRISIKCTDKNELLDADGFENFGLTEVYYASTVTLEDGIHNFPFNTPYNYDTTRNLIVQICYSGNATVEAGCGVSSSPPLAKYVFTTYKSALSLGGIDASVQNVCGVDKNSNIRAISARPAFTFTFCEADPLPFDIVWTQGPHLSDSTIANPLGYVPGSTRYVVQTIGRSTCIMRDTLDIYVPEHDFSISPEDTAICFGEETPIQGLGNGWRYWWYEYDNGQYIKDGEGVSCFECPTPTIKPSKTTDYRIVVSDSVFCYDTLNARIEVLPLPDVRILTEDTTVKYGKPFQILASGARLYNWTPVSSLNNPNISYPIAQPTEDTRYVLGGISANGCRAFDTLYVTIDDRDNLFVPSAFSPNGDGKNDMFKITNLTFQKVMEFRVFNRWGQEIFSTTDNSRGWDGTWKGVDQNIGTYSYLIRVGFPDGLVETYRGEVTLIR